MYLRMYVCMYVCMYLDRYVCMCVYVHTVDGGNLAPLEYTQFQLAPHPLFNIVRECGVRGIWSNDINLAPPHLATAQC